MGKQTTIIMLPTDESNLAIINYLNDNTSDLLYGKIGFLIDDEPDKEYNTTIEPQHLYEVSNEPIKAGDLCYLSISQVVERAHCDMVSGRFSTYKVISTTDTSFDDVPELSKEKVSTYIKQH